MILKFGTELYAFIKLQYPRYDIIPYPGNLSSPKHNLYTYEIKMLMSNNNPHSQKIMDCKATVAYTINQDNIEFLE